MTPSEKILEKLEQLDADDPMTIVQWNIIRALLLDRERLRETLTYYQATPFCPRCKSKSKPDSYKADEAISQSAAMDEGILK